MMKIKVAVLLSSVFFLGACGEMSTSQNDDTSRNKISTNKSVTLMWTPPLNYSDGSQLNDLSGYKIRYGTKPSQYTDEIDVPNSGISEFTVDGLQATTYYFTISAYNSDGRESSYAREANITLL